MSDDIQTDFFDIIGTAVPDLSKLGFIDLVEWCIIHDIKNSSKESRAIWDKWHENNAEISISPIAMAFTIKDAAAIYRLAHPRRN